LFDNDFRWLIAQGFVQQQVATTRPSSRQRTFHPVGSLVLFERICCALTESGIGVTGVAALIFRKMSRAEADPGTSN
jgi:hypothetical protein